MRCQQAIVLYQHVLVVLGQLLHCLIEVGVVRLLPNHNRLFLLGQGVGVEWLIQACRLDWFAVMVWPHDKVCTGKTVMDDRELHNTT